MGNLVQLIATGAPQALSIISHYINSPVIGGAKLSSDDLFSAPNWKKLIGDQLRDGIPIEAETYEESMAADVSENMILNLSKGRSWVNDNIAPKPRIWEISGYVSSDPILLKIEKSGLFAPSLEARKIRLRSLGTGRELVWFKTKENEIVQVGIRAMRIRSDAAVRNKIPVSMTLCEIVTMYSSDNTVEDSATPPLGGDSGAPKDVGSSSVSKIGKTTEAFIKLGLGAGW